MLIKATQAINQNGKTTSCYKQFSQSQSAAQMSQHIFTHVNVIIIISILKEYISV